MTVLQSSDLKDLVNGVVIRGCVLCESITLTSTKDGKPYASGVFRSGEASLPFRAWSGTDALSYIEHTDVEGKVVDIEGVGSAYQGAMQLKLSSLRVVDEPEVTFFLPCPYNCDSYEEVLKKLVQATVTPKGYQLADRVLFSSDIMVLFKREFAASNHHDNCVGGLLAHTLKVCKGLQYYMTFYRGLFSKEDGSADTDFVDLVMLGGLFHDIGKVYEMSYGVYTKHSIVTHRFLGAEYLMGNKDYIISSYGEDWWYNLVSVVMQHHDEYAERCRTLAAYLVSRAEIGRAHV